MSNLATTAHDAGKLVGFALRPRQTPWTSTEYAGLLERYESDSQFRAIVDGLTEGLGMRIVDVSTQGLFLSAAEGSPFRLAAEDYRQGMSAQDRVLHGVIQVAIAAFTFPKADVLDQDDTVAPAHITPTKLAEYIRNFAEAHAAKSPQEDQEEESVHRRTWREALARAVTMETSGGKESSRSLTGMCRYALNFLESQGLMRVVDAENSVYQGTTAYRVRLKYRAAHELLTLMRTTPPPKPAN
ncbi:MAG: hypothetical protein H7A46_21235 [Verrucomicrobiales bacterium]|nr:hypothetical protein [Verrucomicrobiales bacterium]